MISMILQQDRALVGFPEMRVFGIFALRDQREERGRPTVILDHLEAIEPMLDMRAPHHQHRPVPFPGGLTRFPALAGSDRLRAAIMSYSDPTVRLPSRPILASGWFASSSN